VTVITEMYDNVHCQTILYLFGWKQHDKSMSTNSSTGLPLSTPEVVSIPNNQTKVCVYLKLKQQTTIPMNNV